MVAVGGMHSLLALSLSFFLLRARINHRLILINFCSRSKFRLFFCSRTFIAIMLPFCSTATPIDVLHQPFYAMVLFWSAMLLHMVCRIRFFTFATNANHSRCKTHSIVITTMNSLLIRSANDNYPVKDPHS